MAELNDVYGNNYQDVSKQSKNNYILNIISNNIAHRQFNFHLTDTTEIWDQSNNLLPKIIDEIIKKVKTVNKHIHLTYIDKKSQAINMLPELIIDTPVEYFLIIDSEFNRAYYIYITPSEVNAY